MTDFLEWLLELPLTEGQKAEIRDHLVDAWRRGEQGLDRRACRGLQVPRAARRNDAKKKELGRQLVRQRR
jgi:hypothetical protein